MTQPQLEYKTFKTRFVLSPKSLDEHEAIRQQAYDAVLANFKAAATETKSQPPIRVTTFQA